MHTYDDLYDIGDETVKQNAYKEFKLGKIEENNLKEIERSLESKSITSVNKADFLEYLDKLYKQILVVKGKELDYEGDANDNVNEYLTRIRTLIMNIKKV